ncbi:hypothetical protein HA402_007184 [Bradysia odoriphaga]|nr:hypothetical protein HA402_007184 [Bradysia odoriphaga]
MITSWKPNLFANGMYPSYRRTLINDINKAPKNYTIIYQYFGAKNKEVAYLEFDINSPTAMAMINTSYVGEQEFNAVAYDMNTEHFVANMSVYGIRERALQRPFQFEGVI